MGGSCGVAVEVGAVRISYRRNGRWFADSVDAEGAEWLLSGKLVDCGPFDDVVLTGRDTDVVESLLRSLDTRGASTVRTVDEGAALLAYAKSVDSLASARSLLVLDLGSRGTSAFTLDVAAGQVSRSVRRSALSGDGLDDIVAEIVMSKGVLPEPESPETADAYRQFFRDLKELLSTSRGVRAPNDGPMLVTRDEFDSAVSPLVLQLLEWAAPSDPDAVLLVGGGARMPVLRELVEQEWDVPVLLPDSPASVISEGAALEAVPRPPEMDIFGLMSEARSDGGVTDFDTAELDPAETVAAESVAAESVAAESVAADDADTEAFAAVGRPSTSSAADEVERTAFQSDPAPLPSRAQQGGGDASESDAERAPARDYAGPVLEKVLDGGRYALGVVRAAPAVSAMVLVLFVLFAAVFIPVGPGPVEVVQVPTDSNANQDSDSGFVPEVSSSEFPVQSDSTVPVPPVEPIPPTDPSEIDDQQYPTVGFGSGTGLDVGN